MFVIAIILAILGVIAIVVLASCWIESKKYSEFVFEHSITVRNMQALNSKYAFKHIPRYDMSHSYDNQYFYNSISPQDYLIYELVHLKQDIQRIIREVRGNQTQFDQYQKEINFALAWGQYDAPIPFENAVKLVKAEQTAVNSLIQRPTLLFGIVVRLVLTDMNGRRCAFKENEFGIDQIEGIIAQLERKAGERYLDKQIWDAICRVERGKVSNKIRFAIYRRDGYRCQKCGAQTQDLEIDHIFPISKGGKSNFENLQTLCHNCNTLKSNNIETTQQQTTLICPLCSAPLVFRTGKYGQFFGCSNYPKCKYTKKKM